MSQSEMLRQNVNQHSQKNVESHKQDFKIKDVISNLINNLRYNYPDLKFGYEKTYPVRILEKMVSDGSVSTQESTTIKPDGGLVWVTIKGVKYYILVSEQKKQGTNDVRIIEGKKSQSHGNAVERLGKNVIATQILFGEEEITPFVVFLQGCDFYEKESTIPDRVRSIAMFQPMNQINLYKKQIQKYNWFAGSYFMRGHSKYEKPGTSDWTFDEMLTILSEVASQSVEYYLEKYGK